MEQAARFGRRAQLSVLHKAPMHAGKLAKKGTHGASPAHASNAIRIGSGSSPRLNRSKTTRAVSRSKGVAAGLRFRWKGITLALLLLLK